jgi:predicted branched-subunit amino acid permease
LLPWVAWQTGTAAGVLLGPLIPAAWQLEFSMPLVFLALLVPLVRDRAALVAAIAAGLVAVAGRGLPWNLGLILAAVVGVGSGLFAERAPVRTAASDHRRRAA